MLILFLLITLSQQIGISLSKKPKCFFLNLKENDEVQIKYTFNGQKLEVFLFDPFQMQFQINKQQYQFTVLYDGTHKVCFKNLDGQEQVLHFDFDKRGLDVDVATRQDMITTKLALNDVDSAFRWIQLNQKKQYESELKISNQLSRLYKSIRLSILMKASIIIIVGVAQVMLIRRYINKEYEMIL